MKLAIIFNHNKLSGRLTRFWTGCYAYHTAWVDEEAGVMYDMNLLRRRRAWPHYPEAEVILEDFPQVTREYLERRLTEDDARYGVVDYCLFMLRPLFHLLGYSTRNAAGVICSEMCNIDARACGYDTPWPLDAPPPSPCDWFRWLLSRHHTTASEKGGSDA